ncbi:hypothetical protein PG999_014605 [Apiospora kogelbergensis]|uniref:Uncharacterized protein n=1 Tax=Apiospora kogelbergensis TaxID=1337665 RepID=A0AAW0QDT3_9PEZI
MKHTPNTSKQLLLASTRGAGRASTSGGVLLLTGPVQRHDGPDLVLEGMRVGLALILEELDLPLEGPVFQQSCPEGLIQLPVLVLQLLDSRVAVLFQALVLANQVLILLHGGEIQFRGDGGLLLGLEDLLILPLHLLGSGRALADQAIAAGGVLGAAGAGGDGGRGRGWARGKDRRGACSCVLGCTSLLVFLGLLGLRSFLGPEPFDEGCDDTEVPAAGAGLLGEFWWEAINHQFSESRSDQLLCFSMVLSFSFDLVDSGVKDLGVAAEGEAPSNFLVEEDMNDPARVIIVVLAMERQPSGTVKVNDPGNSICSVVRVESQDRSHLCGGSMAQQTMLLRSMECLKYNNQIRLYLGDFQTA